VRGPLVLRRAGVDRGGVDLRAARRTRRQPRPWQFDYLHLRRLLDDLRPALEGLVDPGGVVLDVFCGSRPYDDLFASGVRIVGLDIDDRYGVADIVTTEFLPCADGRYDGVACIEAFHYVTDPAHGVRELRRVVKPGGRVVITVPLVWEYDRHIVEHRYTPGSLRHLFAGWDDVVVAENGGRAVAWTLLTGTLLRAGEEALGRRFPRPAVQAAFGLAYVGLNGVGALLDSIEQGRPHPRHALAPNIMLTARRPADG
jgi:SAM-dependent methyltransferase